VTLIFWKQKLTLYIIIIPLLYGGVYKNFAILKFCIHLARISNYIKETHIYNTMAVLADNNLIIVYSKFERKMKPRYGILQYDVDDDVYQFYCG